MSGGRASRRKGHDWEREVARQFREALPGADVTRGWQSRAGTDQPDVDGTPFWVECKVGKRPNILAALRQADEAKGNDPRPSLAICKTDRDTPTVTLYLDDFLDLVGEWWERGRA